MTGRKKHLISIIFICCLILITTSNIFAEDTITVEMENTNLEVGTSVNLIINISNNDPIKNINISGVQNFELISNSQSTSTETINGKSIFKKSFNVVLMPELIGEYNIMAIIEFEDRTEESNIISVTVKKNSMNTEEEKEDLFVEVTASKDNCYFGERLLITYDLYTRYNISEYGFTDEVSIDGVILKDIPAGDLTGNQIIINGNQYLKYEVKKIIITPIEYGELTIPSFNFQVNISSGNLLSRSQPKHIETDQIKINVQELPALNKPNNYSGLIGKLEAKATYDKSKTSYGEPVTLNVKLSGTANLDIIDSIYPKEVSDFSIYETQKQSAENIVDNAVISSKEYEIIIVPNKVGTLNFQPKTISYFDTSRGTYEYIEIPGQTIEVTGEEVPVITQQPTENNNYSKNQPIEISQVMYNQLSNNEINIRIHKYWLYLIIALILIGIGVIIGRRYFKNIKKDDIYKKLETNIKKAKDQGEIYNIVYEFILEKHHISIKSNSKKDVRRMLNNSIDAENICKIIDYLEHEKFYLNQNIDDIKTNILEMIKEAQ